MITQLRNKETGFSLLELSVAVGVAAIVAAGAITATTTFIGSAQDKRDGYVSNAETSISNAESSSLALGAAGVVEEAATPGVYDLTGYQQSYINPQQYYFQLLIALPASAGSEIDIAEGDFISSITFDDGSILGGTGGDHMVSETYYDTNGTDWVIRIYVDDSPGWEVYNSGDKKATTITKKLN